MKTTCTLLTAAALCLSAGTVLADQDYDLRLNGDFNGSAVNAATAPGWTVEAFTAERKGSTQILQGEDWDEFNLAVNATGTLPLSVTSDLHPVVGKTLKIETEVHGNGSGSVGFLAFDANRQPIAGGAVQPCTATAYKGKVKAYFPIAENVKFVKIQLTANPNARLIFGDVDAEFKLLSFVPQTVPAVSAPAPQPSPVSVPQAAVPTAPAAPAVVPAGAVQTAATAPWLINDKLYSLSSVSVLNVFQATLPLGGEIEFDLEEDAANGLYWSIQNYDASVCRVKVDHDRGGIWPFRYDKAEIELKGLSQGQTTVTFTCPPDRQFTVILTVR